MRFVITGEWNRNRLLRLILMLFLIYVLFFWLTAGLMYFERMGLDPATVASYYLGDADQEFGRPAKPFGSMVEDAHMHMFALGMLVLVLTHLLLFVPLPGRLKYWLTIGSFGTTLLNEICNWLVRFAHPSFSYLKVATFLAMEATLLALLVVLAIYTARPGRNAYKDTAKA